MKDELGSCSALAPAKLTRRLAVVGVRPDGLHLIDAEMVTVSLFDEVRLVDNPAVFDVVDPDGYLTQLEERFGPIPRDNSNLVHKALTALGVRAGVVLTKRIPFGAGLGGGSSDAAAVFRLLGQEDKVDLAASIGADLPFCIRGGRAHVHGFGDLVESLPFVEEEFLLFLSPVLCPTGTIYRLYDEVGSDGSANDLRKAALAASKELSGRFEEICTLIGSEVNLAGSGSTLFLDQSDSDVFDRACELTRVSPNSSTTISLGRYEFVVWRVHSVRGEGSQRRQ
jgi:4-diphosphocytidyl-2-C-methyl-D-erythritol kinase